MQKYAYKQFPFYMGGHGESREILCDVRGLRVAQKLDVQKAVTGCRGAERLHELW